MLNEDLLRHRLQRIEVMLGNADARAFECASIYSENLENLLSNFTPEEALTFVKSHKDLIIRQIRRYSLAVEALGMLHLALLEELNDKANSQCSSPDPNHNFNLDALAIKLTHQPQDFGLNLNDSLQS